MKYSIIFYVLIFLTGCCHSGNPDIQSKESELKIIPSDQVVINWDSTVYQHNSKWISQIDTLAADSVARELNQSGFLVEEMWYPNENTRCAAPTRVGSEIIIKLAAPDSGIYKFGFQKNTGGFPISCFSHWRHYRFVTK